MGVGEEATFASNRRKPRHRETHAKMNDSELLIIEHVDYNRRIMNITWLRTRTFRSNKSI